MCMYYLYCVGMYTNEYVYDSISVYMHVFASMCLNLCVCACICFSVLHKTQKGKGCPGQDLVPCNVLSKRESNASKTALTVLGLEHPSTERHVPESTTEPTLALTLHEILVYLFPEIKYTHIQTIHTYTYIYIQYMQYMHIQAHTCMRQSRSEGVFGGLWQTLYVSGDDETSPIGWGGAWDRVDKLGSGL